MQQATDQPVKYLWPKYTKKLRLQTSHTKHRGVYLAARKQLAQEEGVAQGCLEETLLLDNSPAAAKVKRRLQELVTALTHLPQ